MQSALRGLKGKIDSLKQKLINTVLACATKKILQLRKTANEFLYCDYVAVRSKSAKMPSHREEITDDSSSDKYSKQRGLGTEQKRKSIVNLKYY